MKKIATLIIVFVFFFGTANFFSPTRAFDITDDPQYVIMNFSTINELNWAVPETEWQTTVKPKILEQLHELRTALPPGNAQHKLAWSTLMEYMNFPLDTPSDTSPYAIKMRRILEITDAENIPIYIPLNGFQWWDQLPELYNWWDPDGTHTDPRFFARQKNPAEFKQRFIKGYNPNNIWNVEWQDWQTPMKLNYRNWGGGGFRLAPPPNLFDQHKTALTYRGIQQQRLAVILKQIVPFLDKWQKEGRGDLFAGITIGTEVSLNASIKPSDEFVPYGYRDIQDELCDPAKPTCGTTSHFTAEQIHAARQRSVNQYLLDLTHFVASFGIPKQRIYTHVWSEAKKGEPRYENYAAATVNPYSRPGLSLYGYAQNPLSLPDWANTLKQAGEPAWGAPEYSAGTSRLAWLKGLRNTFNNPVTHAHIMAIYNWAEHRGTGAIPAIAAFLQNTPSPENACALPEILPTVSNDVQNPSTFSWATLSPFPNPVSFVFHVKKGDEVRFDDVDVASGSSMVFPSLPPGTYSWYLEAKSCDGYKQFSQPRSFTIVPMPPKPVVPKILNWFESISQLIQKIIK